MERRTIVAHARPDAFVDHTQSILARLGYAIVSPEEFEEKIAREGDGPFQPDLRIVDERRLAEVVEEAGEAAVRIILLTGRHGATGADARIVGAAKRPVGLHDLYRLLQLIFEDTPRSTPRVPTHIATVCRRAEREWRASILSLSENGCLLRSPEVLPLGSEIELSFSLPRIGNICVRAETSYQYLPDLGLVFSAMDPGARSAIESFVTDALLV